MARDLHVGDLVAARDQVEKDGSLPASHAGVVVELRRADCKVFYPESRTARWNNQADLVRLRVTAGENSAPARLNRLLRRLEATECELQAQPDGIYRLSISHAGIDLRTLEEIRDDLREDLLELSIEPQGMGAIRTILRFR